MDRYEHWDTVRWQHSTMVNTTINPRQRAVVCWLGAAVEAAATFSSKWFRSKDARSETRPPQNKQKSSEQATMSLVSLEPHRGLRLLSIFILLLFSRTHIWIGHTPINQSMLIYVGHRISRSVTTMVESLSSRQPNSDVYMSGSTQHW